ncbi:MAG TPA: ABC transporter permease [Polyangia bacterium]
MTPGSATAQARSRFRFAGLLENETLKLLRRRRPQLVAIVLTLFLAISVWAQHQREQMRRQNQGTAGETDWRAQVERRIQDAERRGRQRRIFVAFTRMQQFEAARLRYHLERDINPNQQTGPLYSRGFAALASTLLLPLLVTVLCADLVSSESSAGTIKMLLTRPVPRWKVLLSKYVVMAGFATLLVAAAAILSWLIAGFALGWRGFSAPMLSGFRFGEGGVDLSNVRASPLWLDTLAAWGLAWYSAIVVGVIATTFSVIFKSTAGAMGTLIAVLAAGMLLGQMAEDWWLAKWIFVTNLPLPQFYSGVPPPVTGMTLGHSVGVLTAWAAGALGFGTWWFSRRDVTA